METSSDDSCCVTKTGESNSCDSVFERLFSAVSCVSLPQPSWAAHLINLAGVRDVVFIDAAVAHRTSDGSSVLFNRKALHVKSNMEVQVYILDKLIDSAAIGKLLSATVVTYFKLANGSSRKATTTLIPAQRTTTLVAIRQWQLQPRQPMADVGRPFATSGASVNFTTDASLEKVDSNREATIASSL
ncbi:hypothetical protein MRX96_007020 [Rhipicephalus microplus]